MDDRELATLLRLDLELPIVDGRLIELDRELHRLVEDRGARTRLLQRNQEAIAAWRADAVTDNLPVDVPALVQALHRSVPEDTSPEVIKVLDLRLARLIQIGTNIASGGAPLP